MDRKTSIIIAMLVGTVAFFALVAVSVVTSTSTKDLKMVHIVMRHGERTPADTYPNDPYINETFYPIGWGQITNRGKSQLYDLGKFLRERYAKFLGDHYTPDLYYTQSTDVDRTKVSMQLVNAGLWPPVGDQVWGPLNWQPIPVHAEPLAEDNLLLVRRPCPAYHLELKNVMKSPEIQAKLTEYEEVFKHVSKLTGKDIKNFDDAQDVFSTLKAEEGFNLTLPDWTKGYYPDVLYEPTVFSFIVNAYNDKLIRLKGGVLLKKLLNDWKSVADGSIKPSGRKAFLYGGHDSTITNLMRALRVWDPQLPGYGITVLLEFSRDMITDDFGLEVYLKNSTATPPVIHQLTIPGCETFCPLTKLEELTKRVIPENWEEECKSDVEGYTAPPPSGP